MSEIHEFKCDKCNFKVKAKWNGEHYLAPVNWVQLYDHNKAEVLDQHLCAKCHKNLSQTSQGGE